MRNVFPPQDIKSIFGHFEFKHEKVKMTFLIQIKCNSEIICESFVKNLNETFRLLTVFTMHVLDTDHHKETSQLALICSKSTIETVEKGVKYV